jgi:bacterioferritin
MPLKDLDIARTLKLLSRIMGFELAGVVRYTHYSLMVTGPNRIPIVAFMKAQAAESLLHAQQAGELLTGLGGHPTLQIAEIDETYRHAMRDILEESAAHESRALTLYKELLGVVVRGRQGGPWLRCDALSFAAPPPASAACHAARLSSAHDPVLSASEPASAARSNRPRLRCRPR